ncbi:MAG: XdhC/CoxI family protein, partial [Planktothrix sp.]
CEWAKQVIKTGQLQVITYDTTAPEDIILGLGLGCNGIVQVLIEPLDQNSCQIQWMDECLNNRKIGAIATIFESEEPFKLLLGSKIFINQQGIIVNQIEDLLLSEQIFQDSQTALSNQQSQVKTYFWNQTEIKGL